MSNIVNATDESFEKELKAEGKSVLVDFWAEWCGPCKMVDPHLKALAADRADSVKVVKVNVDECPQVAARFGIRSIPTLMIFQDGEPLDTKVGAQSKGALDSWVSSRA